LHHVREDVDVAAVEEVEALAAGHDLLVVGVAVGAKEQRRHARGRAKLRAGDPSSVATSAIAGVGRDVNRHRRGREEELFVSVRVCVFQTRREVSVASTSVVPAGRDCERWRRSIAGGAWVVPLPKSTRLMPLKVEAAAIEPENAIPPVANPITLACDRRFVKSGDV